MNPRRPPSLGIDGFMTYSSIVNQVLENWILNPLYIEREIVRKKYIKNIFVIYIDLCVFHG